MAKIKTDEVPVCDTGPSAEAERLATLSLQEMPDMRAANEILLDLIAQTRIAIAQTYAMIDNPRHGWRAWH